MTAATLNPRHSIFLDHWLRHFNGGRAAIDTGFAPKNARQQAMMILSRPEVQEEIERRHTRTLARMSVTRGRIVEEQAKIAFASMGNYIRFVDGQPIIDLTKATADQMAAIAEITTETEVRLGAKPKKGKQREQIRVIKTKLKLHDRLRGLELLGRPFGLSNVNVRVTLDDQRPVLDDMSDEDLDALRGLLLKALPGPVIEAVATEINEQEERDDE